MRRTRSSTSIDPTFGAAYTLTCSSLGLDRPIKTDRDFARRLHEKVEVRLYAPVDGKKEYEGELLSFDEETFTILTDKGERTFEREKAAKVCLAISKSESTEKYRRTIISEGVNYDQ